MSKLRQVRVDNKNNYREVVKNTVIPHARRIKGGKVKEESALNVLCFMKPQYLLSLGELTTEPSSIGVCCYPMDWDLVRKQAT